MLLLRYIIMRFIWMFITLFLLMSLVLFATCIAHLNIWRSQQMDVLAMFEYTKNEYLEFLRNVYTRWDWGTYGNNDADVWKTLVEKAPITIKLNLIAFTFYFRSMFKPGIGSYMIAIHTPMTVLISVFYAAITLFFIFIMDIMYGVIDPRIRVLSNKK